MSVGLKTKVSTMVLLEREEISGTMEKEKLIKTVYKNKKKSPRETSRDQVAKFSQTISYQRNPTFIQFIFDETIIPLVEALRELGIVRKVLSPKELQTIRDTAANSLFYELLKGVAEKSIALRMETLQLAILKINMMNPGEDGTPRNSPDTFLASLAVEYCVKRLIKSTSGDRNTEKVWNSEEGKQFFVDLSLLNEQYFNCGFSTPIDILIYKLETAAYLDPELQKFITATTYGQYKPIKKIVYKRNDKTERAVVEEAGTYFSESLRDAYFLFSLGLDKSLQNLSKDLKRSHLFRKNTIATVRVMKKTERMKHLNFLNLIHVPERHVVMRKSIIIEEVEHTLAITREIKTNLAKVITLTKKGTEDVDVYLFVQIVKDPHQSPDPEGELLLLKFEVTAGTNLIWLREADYMAKKVIINEFKDMKYAPSMYTAIKFKNEIILVEIFKQLGISLNSRTRAGTIQTYEETLKPKYDNEFKEDLHNVLESSLGAPISQYLAKCYHNKDLDMAAHAAAIDQKFMKNLTKLSITHIEEMAEKSKRKREYPYKWVFKSILAAGYDDPINPVDVGDSIPLSKKAEKIKLELLYELFKTALKKKDSNEILLGLVDTISESISDAFRTYSKDATVIKMLEDTFVTEKLDNIFKDIPTDKKVETIFKKVEAIFKKLLIEWNLKCTEKQLALFSKFFKSA